MSRARPRHPRGQVLPIVAVAMVVLVGFAGVAVDIGRVWAERRYLQNAVDAAALAGCDALIDDATHAQAAQAAHTIGSRNLGDSPSGTTGVLRPVGSPTYQQGSQPRNLANGVIVEADGTVRVAVNAEVPTVLARALGVIDIDVRARAMCRPTAYPDLPIVVRRYLNPEGPNRTRGRTPANRKFVDYLATSGTSEMGQVDPGDILGYGGRTPASPAFPGPTVQIYGPQSKASNASWYHGLAVFDIRNFKDSNSRVYFNGVPPGSQPSTQKNTAWTYITRGYPGPGFPPVPRQGEAPANNQVAVLSGLNTAQVMGAFRSTYRVGDEVLLPVYYGNVHEVSGFSINPPPEIVVDSTGNTGGPTFTVARQPSFQQSVTLRLMGDDAAATTSPARPEYDLIDESAAANVAPRRGFMTASFSPNNFQPAAGGTRVRIQNIQTNNVPAGIYTVWLQGQSASPVRIIRYPVSVSVGGAVRDFGLQNSTLTGETATSGGSITLPLHVSTTTDAEAWGGGLVRLSIDPSSLPPGMGASNISFSSTSVQPGTSDSPESILTISTAGVGPGEYTLVLRATGTNGDNQPVTHLANITINVQTSTGDSKYIEIIGWAIFRITTIGANFVNGQAISAVYAESDDPSLRPQQRARLIPWQ